MRCWIAADENWDKQLKGHAPQFTNALHNTEADDGSGGDYKVHFISESARANTQLDTLTWNNCLCQLTVVKPKLHLN